jgi:putative transposase
MGSTFHCLRFHLVFATKERQPWISQEWRAALHEYLGGTVRGLDGMPLAVGGVADHVHLLLGLKPVHCIADFVRELKKASSIWAVKQHNSRFSWQEGYSIFSVSQSQSDVVREYVLHQEEHHRRQDFRGELVTLLQRHGIEFETRYLE